MVVGVTCEVEGRICDVVEGQIRLLFRKEGLCARCCERPNSSTPQPLQPTICLGNGIPVGRLFLFQTGEEVMALSTASSSALSLRHPPEAITISTPAQIPTWPQGRSLNVSRSFFSL